MGVGCTSDKTEVFSTRTKNKLETRCFLSDMKFCFLKRLASALEENFPGSVAIEEDFPGSVDNLI
jgi:hypothetical protein